MQRYRLRRALFSIHKARQVPHKLSSLRLCLLTSTYQSRVVNHCGPCRKSNKSLMNNDGAHQSWKQRSTSCDQRVIVDCQRIFTSATGEAHSDFDGFIASSNIASNWTVCCSHRRWCMAFELLPKQVSFASFCRMLDDVCPSKAGASPVNAFA